MFDSLISASIAAPLLRFTFLMHPMEQLYVAMNANERLTVRAQLKQSLALWRYKSTLTKYYTNDVQYSSGRRLTAVRNGSRWQVSWSG